MAKSKRAASQPSRQQRRLRRQDEMARAVLRGDAVMPVPSGFAATAARIWQEVTDGQGIVLADGQQVPVDGGKEVPGASRE